MPSRAELVLRADALGFDPDTIPNDSKLEQHILYLEKNASTMAGTLATGTLTSSGTASADETVTIGDVTYTFESSLTEAKATQTLTSTGTASDGETVTINGVVYVFKTTLTNTAQNEVLIGASAAASLDNLKSAINATAGEGSTYSTDTVAHPDVTATTNDATTQVIEAKRFGTYANSIPTTESMANFSWGAATMAGGADIVANEILIGGSAAVTLDNLKQAVNAGDTEGGLEGEGTNYSTGTRPHPQVTATTNGATTQVVAARDMAVGEDIATTEAMANFAWGAATLASGVADQNAVDATSAAQVSGDSNKSV